jgi:hypothetical protein
LLDESSGDEEEKTFIKDTDPQTITNSKLRLPTQIVA